ncbi:hypothetical protein [Streptomyces rimosus]|nr:hypothetical protein [Streptomyces rimosus]
MGAQPVHHGDGGLPPLPRTQEAGTAPGRPADAALRQAAADRETSTGER